MRFFGFFIIRWARLQHLHARQKRLAQEILNLAELLATEQQYSRELQRRLAAAEAVNQVTISTTAPSPADPGAETKEDR
ncbi:MAG: hypothetical protein PSY14_06890 [bacterium]|nr:hypothetical protein [bacterium]